MATIILGGAPEANWLPLLIPIILFFGLIVSGEYIFKFIRKKLRGNGHSEGA